MKTRTHLILKYGSMDNVFDAWVTHKIVLTEIEVDSLDAWLRVSNPTARITKLPGSELKYELRLLI